MPPLLSNQPESGISGTLGGPSWVWIVTVPPPPSRVIVTLQGGNGDADLYVYRPTQTEAAVTEECISDGPTNSEICDMVNLPAGHYVVLMYGAANYAGVELKAVITTSGASLAEPIERGRSAAKKELPVRSSSFGFWQ
jgi:hypothetical protein